MKLPRYLFLAVTIFLLTMTFPTKVWAQKEERSLDLQNRSILPIQYDTTPHSFVAGWIIANPRYYGNNNINALLGIGFRGQRWWFETMIQKQWSQKGGNVLSSNRFSYSFGDKASLFLEVAPFLNETETCAVYDMIIFEKRIWRKLNLGIETENVHKKEKDSIGLGPRISIPLKSLGDVKTSFAIAYQMRSGETDPLRFYLVFNKRFKN